MHMLLCATLLILNTQPTGSPAPPPAFEVLWNSPWPTECADNPPPRGGDDPSKPVQNEPDWPRFDIKTNSGSAYNGAAIATLYPHDTGLYPYIAGSCGPEGPTTDYNCTVGVDGKPRTAVNGGIPQLLNLSAHLEKWKADIKRLLPDPEWAGVANLDWESWSPVWEENSYDEYRIYLNRSIELVLEQHPSFTLAEAVPVAKAQFEESSRELWLETLGLAKAMRPKGKWGWYNFAHCWGGCHMQPFISDGDDHKRIRPLGLCPAGTTLTDYNKKVRTT